MLLPSVYMILPLGSLFMTVNSNVNLSDEEAETPRTSAFPQSNCNRPARNEYADSDMTLTYRSAWAGYRPTSHVLESAYIDRELSSIDAMDCGEGARERLQTSVEAHAMLQDKDGEEKEVDIPRKPLWGSPGQRAVARTILAE